MKTLSRDILDITEARVLNVGDIICTKHVNFDPVKAIGRIRNYKGDDQYVIEYPDDKTGIIVYPKEVKFLDDSMYKEYVDNARKAAEDDPELDISKIIHKVNHWIRKRKKTIDRSTLNQENSEMDKAGRLLNKMEGFGDVVLTGVRGKGPQDLWINIDSPGRLEDNSGKIVPTNRQIALNVAGISGACVELGVVEEGEIVNTYTVAISDLKDNGVFLR